MSMFQHTWAFPEGYIWAAWKLSIGVASALLLSARFGHVLLRRPQTDPSSTKQEGSLLPQEELHVFFFPFFSSLILWKLEMRCDLKKLQIPKYLSIHHFQVPGIQLWYLHFPSKMTCRLGQAWWGSKVWCLIFFSQKLRWRMNVQVWMAHYSRET